MGRHRLEGNPPIDIALRQSARAKRLSLRLSRLDGQVTLTMPRQTPQRVGIAFLHSKESWLRKHLAGLTPAVPVKIGQSLPYQGKPMVIAEGAVRSAHLGGSQITVNPKAPVAPQVKGLLRHGARDALAASSDQYAARIGRAYTKLTLRDTRSRWGSCTAQGRLMYSWRLIMAPPAVLDYVAAHEVAHLAEMNHQPAFWHIVAEICPDYRRHRAWLRAHGDQLHRFRFDD